MDDTKNSGINSFIMKLASFIVNKRAAFLVFFVISCIYCITCISKVQVINDLTEYLPDTVQTKQGLDIMEEEFTTLGSAKLLITNITYEKALEVSKSLQSIDGISSVKFYDREDKDYENKKISDSYKNASALFILTFDEPEDTALSQKAIANVRKSISGYESYVYTTVDKDDAASLRNDMKLILVLVTVVIFSVLLFTSKTYMEILIFLMVFVVSAILNMGTNFIFKEISFVTNAVATVLQLAMSIDYAIIYFHRFMEEREALDTIPAAKLALSKAIVEISSSSLTTISGMLALMLMQFGIGMDMGRVLTKAIALSMLTVFLLMPALIVLFSKAIDKTRHKNFVPSIRLWGRLVVNTRFIVLPIFAAVLIGGYIFSSKVSYIYDVNSIKSEKKTEYIKAKERIDKTFNNANVMAVIVPKGDYSKEARLIKALEENITEIDSVTGMSNIKVGLNDEYTLVDSLNPREFAEIADIDIDQMKLLYRFYVTENGQYGALFKNIDDYHIPIISLIDFIHEQKDKRAFDLSDDISKDIDKIYNDVSDARKQLEGEKYSRIIFLLNGPVEGSTSFEAADRVKAIVSEYYNESYVVGDVTSNEELSTSFKTDNTKISILTALFVGIVLLFTFQSAGLPFMLILTIQGSIWINFSFPCLTHSDMFFLSYLIVSAIQMGATIDYAIVITGRYLELRKKLDNKKEAAIEALNQGFPTIITSGTIMVCAGFLIGKITSNATIASLGKTLGMGAAISIILVMSVLPQILITFDKLIDISHFIKGGKENEQEA